MKLTAREQKILRTLVANHITINEPKRNALIELTILQGKLLAPLPYSRKVSNCCGAYAVGNGDCDSSDLGHCPECKENCVYLNENENEDN